MRRIAGIAIGSVMLAASAVGAQQTMPAAPAPTATEPAPVAAPLAPPPPPPGCQDIVIDHSREQTLVYYNEFLREVGHTAGHTAVHSLKIDIADCDATYYYVTEEATKSIMEPTNRYLGGRSAVLIRDVEAVTKASLVPPPPPPSPAKTGKKSAKTAKPAAPKPATKKAG